MRSLRRWAADNDVNRFRIWEALIAKCLVDGGGNRIYQDSEVDADVFSEWDGALVEQLGIAIDEHVGYTSDVWDVKRLEDASKNSLSGH